MIGFAPLPYGIARTLSAGTVYDSLNTLPRFSAILEPAAALDAFESVAYGAASVPGFVSTPAALSM